jgi:transketolase
MPEIDGQRPAAANLTRGNAGDFRPRTLKYGDARHPAYYGWPEDAKFLVPDTVRDHFAAGIGMRGPQARRLWAELFTSYRSAYPELATEIDLMQRRELPAG